MLYFLEHLRMSLTAMVLPPSRLVSFYETLCTKIYQAALVEFKDWAIIYCTLSIIPILWPAVIFGEQIGLDLGWILADFPAVFF